ncbi:hypothetical protein V8E36_006774 [Tilletia maclaganii]
MIRANNQHHSSTPNSDTTLLPQQHHHLRIQPFRIQHLRIQPLPHPSPHLSCILPSRARYSPLRSLLASLCISLSSLLLPTLLLATPVPLPLLISSPSHLYKLYLSPSFWLWNLHLILCLRAFCLHPSPSSSGSSFSSWLPPPSCPFLTQYACGEDASDEALGRILIMFSRQILRRLPLCPRSHTTLGRSLLISVV